MRALLALSLLAAPAMAQDPASFRVDPSLVEACVADTPQGDLTPAVGEVTHLRGRILDYRANTVATTALAIEARKHLFAVAEKEGIEFDLERRGILHVYRDKAGFDAHQALVSTISATKVL